MLSRLLIFVICLGFPLVLASPQASIGQRTTKPIWSRQATPFGRECPTKTRVIPSPDHLSKVEIFCPRRKVKVPIPDVLLVTGGRHFDVPLNYFSDELLWAPDSHAFFVNGGMSSIAGFFVTGFILDHDKGVREITLTDRAQMDMVKSFPPCKALPVVEDCDEVAKDPQYNMSGLTWSPDSSAIYVFAEVIPRSSYGGIMGQVIGYELAVPSGKILKRLSAKEVKEQWSKYAAWNVYVPDPPQYDPQK